MVVMKVEWIVSTTSIERCIVDQSNDQSYWQLTRRQLLVPYVAVVLHNGKCFDDHSFMGYFAMAFSSTFASARNTVGDSLTFHMNSGAQVK